MEYQIGVPCSVGTDIMKVGIGMKLDTVIKFDSLAFNVAQDEKIRELWKMARTDACVMMQRESSHVSIRGVVGCITRYKASSFKIHEKHASLGYEFNPNLKTCATNEVRQDWYPF